MDIKKSVPILVVFALLVGRTIKFPVRTRNIPTTPELSFISVSPIYIDDLDPEYNWDSFVANHSWVSGSGTPGDPFKLRRMRIDASDGPYCIFVSNSNKFFQIIDSVLFNTDPYEVTAAIKVFNVTFAFVFVTEIYDSGYMGIYAINSSITLLNNRIHNEQGVGVYIRESKACYMQYNRIWNNKNVGVYVYNSSHIGIIDNDIHYNSVSAISLKYTNVAHIVANTIYDNGDGICLTESGDNIIERNLIYNNIENGVYLESNSSRTNITGNNIYDNRYCITLGSSCEGTTGDNMESCDIRYFDENLSQPSSNDYPIPLDINILGFIGIPVIGFLSVVILVMGSKRYKK